MTIDPSKSYVNPVFRDNYIGGGAGTYAKPGMRIGWYTGSTSTNIEIVNCEFDANDTTSGSIASVGNILNYYSAGIRVMDCTFSRGCPAGMQSVVTIPAQIEFRNCRVQR